MPCWDCALCPWLALVGLVAQGDQGHLSLGSDPFVFHICIHVCGCQWYHVGKGTCRAVAEWSDMTPVPDRDPFGKLSRSGQAGRGTGAVGAVDGTPRACSCHAMAPPDPSS